MGSELILSEYVFLKPFDEMIFPEDSFITQVLNRKYQKY